VLEAADQRGLERIVVTSSVAALGNTAQPEPMDESHAFALADPEIYALSKRRALVVVLEMAAGGLPVVVVQPSAIAGPGDWKPTPVGQSILRYLNAKYPLPAAPGGLSLADVDDVVEGHIAAMSRGTPGQSYILGGENITLEELLTLLSELTRLPGPRGQLPLALLRWAGLWFETQARLTGSQPPITRRLAKSHLGRYAWVSSDKAATALGYTTRPARETLRRSVQWFVSQGYVSDSVAARLPRHLHAQEVQ
jgi:dihydroflavonol-4-reductase